MAGSNRKSLTWQHAHPGDLLHPPTDVAPAHEAGVPAVVRSQSPHERKQAGGRKEGKGMGRRVGSREPPTTHIQNARTHTKAHTHLHVVVRHEGKRPRQVQVFGH